MFTPQQIDEIAFTKALFGGYDMASVDEFLEPFTEDYITLYKENAQLKSRMRILVEKVEEYRRNESRVRDALANTQKTCDRMMREAEAKCARMLEEASAAAAASADEMALELVASRDGELNNQVELAKQAAAETIDKIQGQMNAAVRAMEEMKEYIRTLERAKVPNRLNAKAKMAANPVLTGKASVDRPWLKFYPSQLLEMSVPEVSLNHYLKMACKGLDLPVIDYYGTQIPWARFFEMVDETARALRAAGIGEGDQIPALLAAVPEFLVLLLAAEQVGASLLCRDNTIEENAEAMEKAGAKILFVHDYVTKAEIKAYRGAGIQEIVTISPWRLAVRDKMPNYIINSLEGRYTADRCTDSRLVSWEKFLADGQRYTGPVAAVEDVDRPLFRAYTSGSTGKSKQVIHSSKTMLGVIFQMTGYGASDEFRPTWLVTILPPALVAVTVSMLLVPMASNRLLILDPFVDVYDIDLELMRYKPNTWPLIPMFMQVLMDSKRIPADYDLSHMLTCGAGAEATNNGQIARAQKWLEDHNCHVVFSTSYGQSEAASNITFPAPGYAFGDGNVGIPMPLNVMGVFRGERECGYNELGEICVAGPGVMLGYDTAEATSRTLVRHDDGLLWLHTGDTGYINEDGVVFTLGRGLAKRWAEQEEKRGRLVDIQMENLISDAHIPGLQDCFFVTLPDKAHDGFYVPYMYAVLDEGVSVEQIRPLAEAALNDYQYPAEIIQIPARPFYHFKTNRLHLEPPYSR